MAAAWWQQRGGCDGFTGTVRECADAHAFECRQCAVVRVFVIGRGWREDSTEGIDVVGSNGAARGDVHRGPQCATAANNDAAADDTTDEDTADADANGDCNDIVC